jgi:peptidoglycan biosynthesis protein MviN/MurJ (putative lipid II flippase)
VSFCSGWGGGHAGRRDAGSVYLPGTWPRPAVPALLAELSATMLPFVIFVCLTAHLQHAPLYGISLAALSPSILNISMLLAVWPPHIRVR